jgi:hypothetical protein
VFSLFGWLVADGWCWFVLREEYCWLVVDDWFVLRVKYCWLVADKPSEQAGCCSAAGIRGLLRRQISEKKRVNSSSFHWHFLTWVNKYTCLEVSLKTKETLLGVYPDCPNCSLFCCVCVHFKQT